MKLLVFYDKRKEVDFNETEYSRELSKDNVSYFTIEVNQLTEVDFVDAIRPLLYKKPRHVRRLDLDDIIVFSRELDYMILTQPINHETKIKYYLRVFMISDEELDYLQLVNIEKYRNHIKLREYDYLSKMIVVPKDEHLEELLNGNIGELIHIDISEFENILYNETNIQLIKDESTRYVLNFKYGKQLFF